MFSRLEQKEICNPDQTDHFDYATGEVMLSNNMAVTQKSLLLILLFLPVYTMAYDYCVIGAGPAGKRFSLHSKCEEKSCIFYLICLHNIRDEIDINSIVL